MGWSSCCCWVMLQYVPFEYDDLKEVEALLSVNVIGVHRITQKFLRT